MKEAPTCPYCGNKSMFHKTSTHIYRRDYGPVYDCRPCNAYVGCHKTTGNPLGTLANAELRKWRKQAHSMFDPLWKSGKISRGKAYSMLASKLGIDKEKCHIGMFDIEFCKRVIDLCTSNQLV